MVDDFKAKIVKSGKREVEYGYIRDLSNFPWREPGKPSSGNLKKAFELPSRERRDYYRCTRTITQEER